MESRKNIPHVMLILLLIVIAFTARTVPMMISDQPYNIDGFPLVKLAEDIGENGDISTEYYNPLLNYNSKLPVFPIILSMFSQLSGMSPMDSIQIVVALMGCVAVVAIYAITFKLSKDQKASFFAGLFLALSGIFVYLTAASMKQTVALALIPIALLLFMDRDDWRKRLLVVPIIICMAYTHHLATLILFMTLFLIMLSSNIRDYNKNRASYKNGILDISLGLVPFLIAYTHYSNTKMEFVSDVLNMNDIVLFFSVFFIAMIGVTLLNFSPKGKPWFRFQAFNKKGKISFMALFDVKALSIAIGIAALIVNYKYKVFQGTINTSDTFIRYFIPYLLLATIALMGFNLIRYSTNEEKNVVSALLLTPLTLMLFGTLKGLDPFSFMLVFRSYGYIEYGLAICFGIGAAYLVSHAKSYSRKHNCAYHVLPKAVFVILMVCVLASLPLAYNSEEMYGVQDTTYDYEFSAMQTMNEMGVTHIGTDQRYADIMKPYFNISCDSSAIWNLAHERGVSAQYLLMDEKWVEDGYQMGVTERKSMQANIFYDEINRGNVIYSGGPAGKMIYLVKR